MSYHARIMNIPAEPPGDWSGESAYKIGHRNARHAAAEIANEADAEVARLTADLAVARAERDGLAKALADAIECVESWSAYADAYFQQKHDLEGDLARLRAALPTPPKETP